MSSEKLMVSLAGHPFINVRNSFNSLIPKGLSNNVQNKLINYYLRKLNESPFLHSYFKIVTEGRSAKPEIIVDSIIEELISELK